MKVVIARDASEKTIKLMASQFPGEWDIVTVRAEELHHEIRDADVLIPEGAVIDRRLLAQAKKLKFIQTGAGYDNVDIKACTERGIYVANAAGINARAVAEHVLAFILCWYKNIIPLNGALKSGKFMVDYQGSELSGKVIGVVGLGNIGREVARLAGAFDMKVLGFHYRQTETGPNIEVVDLHTLLSRSDIITMHVALNSKTHPMIGKKEFELMKTDTFFINTSRGAVVDESALITALHKKHISGAGLDVFETEPLPEDNPLRKLDNVILSPHNAGEPDGLFFHKKRFQFFADNIERVIDGKSPQNALNEPLGQRIKTGILIPEVILPEGYNGKILLISVSDDGIEKTVLLRSGDLWHREILRNTEVEIKNLGFENAQVHELGGALVRFEPAGAITIYGASREFGACDKEFAAEMVRKIFREKIIRVRS
ncbi:MAG: phosphoglycerate dehydrogenase [Proteobacteria bacterium]|nr:phosphoglycerate dehydrogenase [Pseudomonadota bacterium]